MEIAFLDWIRLNPKIQKRESDILPEWEIILMRQKEPLQAKIINAEGNRRREAELKPDELLRFNLKMDFEITFNRIEFLYQQYFSAAGCIDYSYFNTIKTQFREYFPPDKRLKGLEYFDEMIDNYIKNLNQVIRKNDNATKENPYPEVFPKPEYWQLFEYWKNQYKNKNELANFSFIFWQMQSDRFIFSEIKPTGYRNWIKKNFGIDIAPLKQSYRVNNQNRIDHYKALLELFQLNKIE